MRNLSQWTQMTSIASVQSVVVRVFATTLLKRLVPFLSDLTGQMHSLQEKPFR